MPSFLSVIFGSSNKGGATFEAKRDIPSLAGKVVLITGAAGDLGRQTATELSRYGRPARLYIADLPRDEAAKKEVTERVSRDAYSEENTKEGETSARTEVHFLDLDLSSFESIRKCATEFFAKEKRLDILVLNAGIISVPPRTTGQNYEIHFGINYLGHTLFTRLLTPVLLRTAEEEKAAVRVVAVSSEGHTVTPKGGIQFDRLKSPMNGLSWTSRYGQSKLALLALTRGLAKRYPQITVAAVHPGRVITGMGDKLRAESFLIRMTKPIAPLVAVPVTVGARNHLWVATSPQVVSGSYYEPVGVLAEGSALSRDEKLIEKLWEWTDAELIGQDSLE
ncbi:NAD(P)-binding protein [Xylariaceae sp. FL1272]|nr:NAD(P)-binding protein [Xylariaceae sp. FL1272]